MDVLETQDSKFLTYQVWKQPLLGNTGLFLTLFMPPGIPGVFRALECLLWCPVSPRPIDPASRLCLVKNRLGGGRGVGRVGGGDVPAGALGGGLCSCPGKAPHCPGLWQCQQNGQRWHVLEEERDKAKGISSLRSASCGHQMWGPESDSSPRGSVNSHSGSPACVGLRIQCGPRTWESASN